MGSITSNWWREDYMAAMENERKSKMPTLEQRISALEARVVKFNSVRSAAMAYYTALLSMSDDDIKAIDRNDDLTKVACRQVEHSDRLVAAADNLQKQIALLQGRIEVRDAMARAAKGNATETDQKLLEMTLAQYMEEATNE